MIVNKLTFIFILFSFFVYSQNKELYFIPNNTHLEYIIETEGGEISNIETISKISKFYIYDKGYYEKRKQDIEKKKKQDLYLGNWSQLPKTLFFKVKSKRKVAIKTCELEKVEKVDYKWLINNKWGDNNDFKLYFLLKTGKEKYLKYEVKIDVFVR